MECRPPASPGRGDVLVRVESVGICGTDLTAWSGRDARMAAGTVVGHEFGGVVVEVGQDVTDRVEGQSVAVDPNEVCERCDACATGSRGVCGRRRLMGVDIDGGLQRYLQVAALRTVVVPGTPDPRSLSLVEPIAVGVHACDRAGVGGGVSVGIVGGGPIGMGCALHAQVLGARDVTVVEPDLRRREAAVERGLLAIAPGSTPDRSWDVVIDTVGTQATIAAASASAERGATICVVGLSHDAAMPAPDDLVRRELSIVGSFCYRRVDLEMAARLVAERGLASLPVDLIEGFEQAPSAFAALERGDLGRGKTVLLP